MKKLILMFLMLLLCFTIFSQEDIDLALKIHEEAILGKSVDIEKCLELLEPYIESNMIARFYYGSALSFSAKNYIKSNPLKSLNLLKKSNKYMDSAMVNYNNDYNLHLLRLVLGLQVSKTSPINRYKVIKEDVDFLLNKENQKNLNTETLQSIYFYCGDFYFSTKKSDKAKECFNKVIELNSDSDFALKSKELLNS